MSFAKAAEELNVTPAALSFQIKSLETHLGAPLFHRLNRAVELTEAGTALAPGTSDGFRLLSAAWQAARRTLDDTSLTITAGPAFTAKWLAPRLFAFAQDHPEIDLRFSASLRMMDFDRDGIDVAIRFGYGGAEDAGLFADPLPEEWVAPVMTPALAMQFTIPDSLRDAPLIFDDSVAFLDPPCDWAAWFRAVGFDFQPEHGPRFSQSDHAVDAALAGVGVVLGRRSLVVGEIADGRLVAPFPTAIGTGARFRFLCAHGSETRPPIAAFREWIHSEIERTAFVTEAMAIVPASDVPKKLPN